MRRIAVCCLALCAILALMGVAAGAAGALSYLPAVGYANANSPSTAIGDYNGDGHLDLATVSLSGDDLSVRLGAGDGTFGAATTSAGPADPWDVAAADFNGDGWQDLVTCGSGAGGAIVTRISNGDGTFAAPVGHGAGTFSARIATADLNGDGFQDVVICPSNRVGVFLGHGDGTFSDMATYPVAGSRGVTTGDFSADGVPDLAVTCQWPNQVAVLMGNGDGTFVAGVAYATDAVPDEVAAGDLDGDARDDLVVATGAGVSVLLNQGDGTFAPHVTYASATVLGVAVGDLDGDGMDDIAMTGPSVVTALVSAGGGTFGPPQSFAAGSDEGWEVAIADFNRDGKADILKTGFNTAGLSVLIGKWEAPAGTMVIDDGAAFTSGALVRLDAAVAEAREMRVRSAGGAWSAWQAYAPNSYFTLPAGDGMKTVEAQYRNTVGQTPTISDGILLDATAPATSDDAPGGWQTGSPVTVGLTGDDGAGGSGVAETQYKLDDAASWATGTSVPVAGDGVHTLRYRSVDEAGNKGDIESCTVRIDGVAPTTVASGADGAWRRSPVTLAFAASDATSGVARTEYTTDGGATWTSGSSATVAAEGETTVGYRAVDVAGNVETARDCVVRIDATAPTAAATAPTGWQTIPLVMVALTGDDGAGGSGVLRTEYKLDGATGWTAGAAVAVSGDGEHTIRYRAVDQAGNVGDADSRTVKLDAAAPVTTVSGVDAAWHRYPVTVVFAATDATSGVARTEYSLDGGATWTAGAVLAVSAQGENAVTYRSVDAAGIAEAPRTRVVRIDTRAPRTSAARVSVRRGKTATFRAKVTDPTPCAADGAKVKLVIKDRRGRVVARIKLTDQTVNAALSIKWRCPLKRGAYTYTAYAADAAGNTQARAAIARLIVR